MCPVSEISDDLLEDLGFQAPMCQPELVPFYERCGFTAFVARAKKVKNISRTIVRFSSK
jgi:hypothetical protein